jgi:hypothetical protein
MTVVARLEAILSANTAEFESAMTRSESRMQKVGHVAGVAGLAIAGDLAYGLDKSVKAAMAAQTETARLGVAFQTAGLNINAYKGQIDKAETSSRNLGFTNEDVRNSLGSLIVATHNVHGAMKDLTTAEDLARFKHQDLATASKTLTMAMAGSQRAIKALGLSLQPVTTAEDKVKLAFKDHTTAAYNAALATAKLQDKQRTAAQVIQLVSDKMKGQGAAFAETAAGGMAKMHAQIGALEENLGKALLPAIVAVTTKLADLAGYLSKHTTTTKIAVGATAALAFALIGVSIATKLWAAAMTVAKVAQFIYIAATQGMTAATIEFDIALLPIILTVGAVVLAIGLLAVAAYEIIKHWSAVSGFFTDMWTKVKGYFTDGINWVKTNWKLFAEALLIILTGPIGAVAVFIYNKWSTIKSDATKAWNAIKGAVGGLVNDLHDTVVHVFTNLPGDIASAFTSGIKTVKNAIVGLFGKVIDWVKGALGISSPSSVFHEIGQNAIQGFINGVGSMAHVLEHAVVGMAESALSHLNPFRGGHTAAPQHVNADAAQNKQFALSQFAHFGWGSDQFPALNALWTQESGWSQYAKNKSGGAYGIPQALPPTKMPYAAQEAGGSSPVSQIMWGLNYIKGRYGSPVAAEAHELSAGWYDRGGWLPKGLSLALNTTGAPERVGGGGGDTVIVQVGPEEVARVVFDQLRGKAQVFQRRNGYPAFGGA